MAYRMKKRCKVHGCPNLHTNRNGYCDDHQIRSRGSEERPSAQERGYDSRWKRFAKDFLTRHPVCEICGAPATCVDHKNATADMMMDAYGCFDYSEENYQALCTACNTRKGKREDVEMKRNYYSGKTFLTGGRVEKNQPDVTPSRSGLSHTHDKKDRV